MLFGRVWQGRQRQTIDQDHRRRQSYPKVRARKSRRDDRGGLHTTGGSRHRRSTRKRRFRDPSEGRRFRITLQVSDAIHVSEITFVRSEGTGLSGLEAILHENPVIITAYGGQLDYLKSGVYYVSFHEDIPFMCNDLQRGHDFCDKKNKVCRAYPW